MLRACEKGQRQSGEVRLVTSAIISHDRSPQWRLPSRADGWWCLVVDDATTTTTTTTTTCDASRDCRKLHGGASLSTAAHYQSVPTPIIGLAASPVMRHWSRWKHSATVAVVVTNAAAAAAAVVVVAYHHPPASRTIVVQPAPVESPGS